jgi:uncharacterized membrane protein YfcA
VFAVFMPLGPAVAATALVHFLNGLFKLLLVGRHADRRVAVTFGLPAFAAAWAGASVLAHLPDAEPWFLWSVAGRSSDRLRRAGSWGACSRYSVLLEHSRWLERLPTRSGGALVAGGVLSGFFGGLSGMQGALRSAFLVEQGLSKEAFVGTGALIAACVDVTRLGVYAGDWSRHAASVDPWWVVAAVAGALLGARFGRRVSRKSTTPSSVVSS